MQNLTYSFLIIAGRSWLLKHGIIIGWALFPKAFQPLLPQVFA